MYVKLFDALLNSSIMEEDLITRWVWIVMLLMADRDGVVLGTDGAIARRANLPPEDVAAALLRLQEPDPISTTPDEEGRRITEIAPNTRLIINYAKYRALKDSDEMRASTCERVRRYRALHRGTGGDVTLGNADVTLGNALKRHTDADPDPEADPEAARTTPIVPASGDVGGSRPLESDQPTRKGKPRKNKPSADPSPGSEDEQALFAYWQETCRHKRAVFPGDPEDLARKRMASALKRLGLDRCKAVIRGAAEDAKRWPDRRNHDTLDLLFRDSGHEAKFQALDPEDPDSAGRSVAVTGNTRGQQAEAYRLRTLATMEDSTP